MIVPFSQPQRIDRKRFRALFRTPTTLQPPPPYFFIILYVVASNTFPFENSSMAVTFSVRFFPCSSYDNTNAKFLLKYFRRTSTLRKFSTRTNKENFPIYGSSFP